MPATSGDKNYTFPFFAIRHSAKLSLKSIFNFVCGTERVMGSALRTGRWLQYNTFCCVLEMLESYNCSWLNYISLSGCVASNTWDLNTFLQITLILRFNGLQLILLHHRKGNFAWTEVNVWSKLWLVSFLITLSHSNHFFLNHLINSQSHLHRWGFRRTAWNWEVEDRESINSIITLVSILKTNYSPVVFTCFYYISQVYFLKLIRLYEEIFAIIFKNVLDIPSYKCSVNSLLLQQLFPITLSLLNVIKLQKTCI